MTLSTTAPDQAEIAYDALADAYDVLVADYDHDGWIDAILAVLRPLGLRGHAVLDVACGTGRSFLPLLERGYDVTGCDISPRMLDHARDAAAGRAELFVADMRELGPIGSFDLVTCLDDAVNYLLTEEGLEAALHGFARNLSATGLAVWDVNTRPSHSGGFTSDWTKAGPDLLIAWQGRGEDGPIGEAAIDVFSRDGECWQRATSVHRQRHWPLDEVRAAAARAGLDVVAVFGQTPGAVLHAVPDEEAHSKLLFVARRH